MYPAEPVRSAETPAPEPAPSADVQHRRAESLLELASELRVEGKLTEARGAVEQAIALDPKNERGLFELALLVGNTGDHATAQKILRKALRRKLEKPAYFHSALAKEIADAGKPEQAIPHAIKAVALDPMFYGHHARLGAVLLQLDQNEDAIIAFRQALQLNTEDDFSRRRLAAALSRTGAHAQAVTEYLALLKRDPRDYMARSELAESFAAMGKYIRASKHARLASKHCPDDFESHYDLGTSFGMSGAGEFAIHHLQRAAELNPASAAVWSNLSAAYLDCGEEKRAIKAARRALQIAPKDPRAWCNLGDAFSTLGRYADAIDAFQNAVDSDMMKETDAKRRLKYAKALLKQSSSPVKTPKPKRRKRGG